MADMNDHIAEAHPEERRPVKKQRVLDWDIIPSDEGEAQTNDDADTSSVMLLTGTSR